MTYEIQPSTDGGYSVGLGIVTARILALVLEPAAPAIWIVQYTPHTRGGWETMAVPIGRRTRVLEVRGVGFEIRTTRDEFMSMLPDLEPAGLFVAQMRSPAPDTLRAEWLFENVPQRLERCHAAGVVLTFDLPHAHEVAVAWSPEREVLARVIQRVA
jgi:hypothetical protein